VEKTRDALSPRIEKEVNLAQELIDDSQQTEDVDQRKGSDERLRTTRDPRGNRLKGGGEPWELCAPEATAFMGDRGLNKPSPVGETGEKGNHQKRGHLVPRSRANKDEGNRLGLGGLNCREEGIEGNLSKS